MKMKKGHGLSPVAAVVDKTKYAADSLGTQGFIEKTLREANSSFGNALHQTEEDLSSLHTKTGKATRIMAAGERVNVHEVITAADKAQKSYDQLVEVRNKIIEAYREMLRKRD
jgi:flagellar hook-basal body complex protein FliE